MKFYKYLIFESIGGNNFQVISKSHYLGNIYEENGRWIFYPYKNESKDKSLLPSPIFWTYNHLKELAEFIQELENKAMSRKMLKKRFIPMCVNGRTIMLTGEQYDILLGDKENE